ncbi:MAG: transposase [Chitinophagales bacterium]
MMEKFKNKYRIPSARLQTWDYGSNAAYFVTICTQNRQHYFGEIRNEDMQLSEMGVLAQKYWYEIPNRFPFVELDAFVVMPNHVHGIIVIDGKDAISKDVINHVSTTTTPKMRGGITGNNNPMLHKNLSRIIRWYKGRCTFEIRKIHADFAWQSRFYDHIIRNDKSFNNISAYIINNPTKWKEDKFYENFEKA